MSRRPIIDAGPALNFFSTNQERLLIGVVGALCTSETVEQEVLRKSKPNTPFEAAARVWSKLGPKYMEVLPDEGEALDAVVLRMTNLPMADRKRQAADLGEVMVIGHAVVAAEAGHDMTILIDDREGAKLATVEAQRLVRLRGTGRTVGTISLIGTTTVLHKAAGNDQLPDRAAMRAVYERLRRCDDGLMPIDRTGLLGDHVWQPRPGAADT